jgi:hypothetical protein
LHPMIYSSITFINLSFFPLDLGFETQKLNFDPLSFRHSAINVSGTGSTHLYSAWRRATGVSGLSGTTHALLSTSKYFQCWNTYVCLRGFLLLTPTARTIN